MKRNGAPVWICGLLAAMLGSSATAAPARDDSLRAVCWRGWALGESAAGSACWLRDDGGALRVEIARHGDGEACARPAWGRLLLRGGQGWTCLADGERGGVLMAWGGRLEEFAPALALRLHVLAILLEAGPRWEQTELDGRGRWLPAARRYRQPRQPMAIASTAAAARDGGGRRLALSCTAAAGDARGSSSRRRLEARGRGAGGDGEIWTLRTANAGDLAGALRIESNRRAGQLMLTPLEALPVSLDPEEVSLPLWPLAELLDLPHGWPADEGGGGAN